MSGGFACPHKPHRAGGHWVVTVRRGNYSAFNGNRFTRSDWSEIRCLACGARWRSKAKYVWTLRDARDDEGYRNV